uniref:Carboxylic ester hydrolase n=1 Tax=Clastoptera arizonana TaxID=38151 RepID=A0A1B6CFD9_9HEMI
MSGSEEMCVTVTIPDGTLRGTKMISKGFTPVEYYSFLGIPYAKPPIGPLRFKEPQPFEPWTGVRDALKEGPSAPQKHFLFSYEMGEEDCLYLNVFTRQLSTQSADLKPVMFYIHAGGFTGGSGDTDVNGPDYLIEEDVVLVTINYRLGALGFLSLENNKLPGNAGLKDQVLALEWVQRNIACFGGDPNKVTLMGRSAGAASVEYHLLSPLSKGLFHRAILQSGSTMNPWAYEHNPKSFALRLAKHLGYVGDDEDADSLLDFFLKVPAMTLVRSQGEILAEKERLHTSGLPFRPVVEKEGPGRQFITQTPREIIKSGEFTQVPMITGCTSNEGNLQIEIFTVCQEAFDKFNSNPDFLIPLNMQVPDNEKNLVAEEIQKFFFGEKQFCWDTVNQYVEFFGDISFYIGLDVSLQLMLNKISSPVYNYLLSYEHVRSFMKHVAAEKYPDYVVQGVPHGDDFALLFSQSSEFPSGPIPADDQKCMKRMIKLWTTFAKTGNPNYNGIETKWEPTTSTKLQYYDLGKKFKMVPGRIHERRIEFWAELFNKYKSSY